MDVPGTIDRLADGRRLGRSTPAEILALSVQSDAEARLREILGPRVGWLPYAAPGADLARALDEITEKEDIDAVVVQWIGLLTFGQDGADCAARAQDIGARAAEAVAAQLEGRRMLDARPVVAMRDADEVAPLLRGALAVPTGRLDVPYHRWVLELRSSEEIAHFASAEMAAALVESGPVAVDHAALLRGALLISSPPYANLEALEQHLRAEVEGQRRAYLAFADRYPGSELGQLDPTPRVVILPGLGLFGVGTSRAEARQVADLAELTVRAKIQAVELGSFSPLPESVRAPVELALPSVVCDAGRPLAGQTLLLAGAGPKAAAVGRALEEAGAAVLGVDPRIDALEPLLCEGIETLECDPADDLDARDALRHAAGLFGGVDGAVIDARALEPGAIHHLFDESLALLRAQGTGGAVLIVGDEAGAPLAPDAGTAAAEANVRLGRIPPADAERVASIARGAFADATVATGIETV